MSLWEADSLRSCSSCESHCRAKDMAKQICFTVKYYFVDFVATDLFKTVITFLSFLYIVSTHKTHKFQSDECKRHKKKKKIVFGTVCDGGRGKGDIVLYIAKNKQQQKTVNHT